MSRRRRYTINLTRQVSCRDGLQDVAAATAAPRTRGTAEHWTAVQRVQHMLYVGWRVKSSWILCVSKKAIETRELKKSAEDRNH